MWSRMLGGLAGFAKLEFERQRTRSLAGLVRWRPHSLRCWFKNTTSPNCDDVNEAAERCFPCFSGPPPAASPPRLAAVLPAASTRLRERHWRGEEASHTHSAASELRGGAESGARKAARGVSKAMRPSRRRLHRRPTRTRGVATRGAPDEALELSVGALVVAQTHSNAKG